GWYHLSAEGRLPAEAVTPIPERLAPLAQQAIPPGVSRVARNQAPRAPSAEPANPDIPPNSPPGVPAISPSSAAAARVLPAVGVAPSAPPVSPSAGATADAPRIVLRATADAWLQVRDRGGALLLNR